MSRKKREAKEEAKAAASTKRAADRARHERDAFAKKLALAKDAAKTTPATGIVDDEEHGR
jgi:hypothetical protein